MHRSYTALADECDTVITQTTCVPAYRAVIKQKDELQREFTALKAAGVDFERIADVGKALKAVVAESAQLPLSEEDYRTLGARHVALVRRVTEV